MNGKPIRPQPVEPKPLARPPSWGCAPALEPIPADSEALLTLWRHALELSRPIVLAGLCLLFMVLILLSAL